MQEISFFCTALSNSVKMTEFYCGTSSVKEMEGVLRKCRKLQEIRSIAASVFVSNAIIELPNLISIVSHVSTSQEMMEMASKCPNLEFIDLINDTLPLQRLIPLNPILKCCQFLKHLELSFFEPTIEECSAFVKLKNLKELFFYSTRMNNRHLEALSYAVNPQLEKLKVSGFEITSVGIQHIAQRLRALQLLDITFTGVQIEELMTVMSRNILQCLKKFLVPWEIKDFVVFSMAVINPNCVVNFH